MCDWSPDDSDAVFLREGWRRAKRKKKCNECDGMITRRSWYFETVFASEYDDEREVTCAMCKACKKVVREFERVHGSTPYVNGLEMVLEECITAEEDELEDDDGDHLEASEAIEKWGSALAGMRKRSLKAAKAVANG
jgi:hypothetical protein